MNEVEIVSYSVCRCGAITLYTADGATYCCKRRNLRQFVNIDLRKLKRFQGSSLLTTVCCDHCVNHYGLDLCACGSGEPTHKCKGGSDVCGKPMQILGEYTSVCASDSWLNRGKVA